MEQIIAIYAPNYIDDISSFLGVFGAVFAGGILVSFLMWSIGFAVRAAFGIVEKATS